MNTKLKMSLLGAAISMAVAGQANAGIAMPRDDINNNGASELVLTVYDAANAITYTRDLGITMGNFNDTGSYSYNVAADLTGAFGSTNTAGMVWSINAADAQRGESTAGMSTDPFTYGTRILSTSTTPNTVGVTMDNGNVFQAALTFDGFVKGQNLQPGHNDGDITWNDWSKNGSNTFVGGGSASYQNMGGAWNGNAQFAAIGNIGDAMSFLLVSEDIVLNTRPLFPGSSIIVTSNDTISSSAATVALMAGTWTLDTAGALSYSAVPVPPAIWLLGSALVGLTGVARRRRESEVEGLEA